jgi:hypothetical protein
MPLLSEALGASLGDGCGARRAFFFAAAGPGLGPGELRKREGEGTVIVSAIYGGRGVCSVLSPA